MFITCGLFYDMVNSIAGGYATKLYSLSAEAFCDVVIMKPTE